MDQNKPYHQELHRRRAEAATLLAHGNALPQFIS
jgi:hypothetical protein